MQWQVFDFAWKQIVVRFIMISYFQSWLHINTRWKVRKYFQIAKNSNTIFLSRSISYKKCRLLLNCLNVVMMISQYFRKAASVFTHWVVHKFLSINSHTINKTIPNLRDHISKNLFVSFDSEKWSTYCYLNHTMVKNW